MSEDKARRVRESLLQALSTTVGKDLLAKLKKVEIEIESAIAYASSFRNAQHKSIDGSHVALLSETWGNGLMDYLTRVREALKGES